MDDRINGGFTIQAHLVYRFTGVDANLQMQRNQTLGVFDAIAELLDLCQLLCSSETEERFGVAGRARRHRVELARGSITAVFSIVAMRGAADAERWSVLF